MKIRPVKDLIDNKTNQPIFVKSHAKATFMTDGKNVEDVIYELKKEGLYSLDIIALVGGLDNFIENEEESILSAKSTLSEDMYNTIIDALEKNKLLFNFDAYQGTVNVQYEEGDNITLGSHIVLPGTGCLFYDILIIINKNTLECEITVVGNQKMVQLNEKQDVLVSGENIKTINGESILGSGNITINSYISTTYDELKELRVSNQLKPGTWYRITDYVATTTQEDTQSADHPFDVLVLATSENTLSEEARAIQHDGDEYFSTSNLNAWKIWYSLDNDANRFEWMGNVSPVNNPTLKGINPEYFIFVDGNGNEMQSYENVIDETSNDIFYWYDYTNDNEGNNTLVLYKTNINGIQQDSDYLNADSSNVFFYQGTEEYDGVIYDKWRKIEPETYTWDNEEKIFVLTKQIVENNSIKEEYLYNAVSIDGTGVIYRMIDEYGNDCPYDFKNILFNYSNKNKVDSSNCSINASLVDGNSFNEPFTPVAYMFIDTDGKNFENYEGFEGKSTDDLFYEYGYETTPDGLENQLCLFKSDVEVYEDEGTDYGDKFFYWGTYDYDGETYDIWKKAEVGEDGVIWIENGDGLGNLGNIFILTNRIVEGETIVSDNKNYYTFTWVDENNETHDSSIIGNDGTLMGDDDEIAGVYNNIIGKYIEDGVNKLPVNIFIGDYNHENGTYYGCKNNTFGVNCNNNIFGNNCYNNTFGNNCDNNTFGDDCYDNTFGDVCYRNAFGNNCYNNTFGENCGENTFGYNCDNNTFGDNCCNNTFGEDCSYNTFSYNCDNNTFDFDCGYNTFGYSCDNNTFGYGCGYNTFGDYCDNNTLSNECRNITFGNHCSHNTFGHGCDNNAFGSSCDNNTFSYNCIGNIFGNYCSHNTFGNYCGDNTLANDCYDNTFDYQCYNNTLGNGCRYNTIRYKCNNNTFGNGCRYNTISYECNNNTFGNDCGTIDSGNTLNSGCTNNQMGDKCYSNTFGDDCSNNTFDNNCNHNTFGDGCGNNTFGVGCNNNTLSDNCLDNTFGNRCRSNSFGTECNDNTFGNECYRNTFANECFVNTFSNDCENNTFGRNCENNTFGNSCKNNTFGDDCGKINSGNTLNDGCAHNQIGNNCNDNTFGVVCYHNTFGNNCNDNTFGVDCYDNTFGNNCRYNTFGDGCTNDTFGNECCENTFGNACDYNTFGVYCDKNTFGDECDNNTFGDECINNTFVDNSGNTRNYCSNNVFENDCSYNKIIAPNVGSSTEVLQNLHIHNEFKGSFNNLKETVINKLNSVIDIDIYQDENGNTCINQINCGTF